MFYTVRKNMMGIIACLFSSLAFADGDAAISHDNLELQGDIGAFSAVLESPSTLIEKLNTFLPFRSLHDVTSPDASPFDQNQDAYFILNQLSSKLYRGEFEAPEVEKIQGFIDTLLSQNSRSLAVGLVIDFVRGLDRSGSVAYAITYGQSVANRSLEGLGVSDKLFSAGSSLREVHRLGHAIISLLEEKIVGPFVVEIEGEKKEHDPFEYAAEFGCSMVKGLAGRATPKLYLPTVSLLKKLGRYDDAQTLSNFLVEHFKNNMDTYLQENSDELAGNFVPFSSLTMGIINALALHLLNFSLLDNDDFAAAYTKKIIDHYLATFKSAFEKQVRSKYPQLRSQIECDIERELADLDEDEAEERRQLENIKKALETPDSFTEFYCSILDGVMIGLAVQTLSVFYQKGNLEGMNDIATFMASKLREHSKYKTFAEGLSWYKSELMKEQYDEDDDENLKDELEDRYRIIVPDLSDFDVEALVGSPLL